MNKFVMFFIFCTFGSVSLLAGYELFTGNLSSELYKNGILETPISISGDPSIKDLEWTSLEKYEKSTLTLLVSTTKLKTYRLQQDKDNYIQFFLNNGTTSVIAKGSFVGTQLKLKTEGNFSIVTLKSTSQNVDLKTTDDLTVDLPPFDEGLNLKSIQKLLNIK